MRQPGQYADSGGSAQMQQHQQRIPRMDHKSINNYQGRLPADHLNSENDMSYGGGGALVSDGQWRWERDGTTSHMLNEGLGPDASRSYYQRLTSEKHGREENMEIGYDDNTAGHPFEGLEQRFYDDIFELTKEQNDAEDVENARHRESVNEINAQYEEQLAALRTRHGNRRGELLRRESHARQQQYQQAAAAEQQCTNNGMGFSNPPHVESYRDRPRFTGGNKDSSDPGFDPRGQYHGGRAYGSGSHYY